MVNSRRGYFQCKIIPHLSLFFQDVQKIPAHGGTVVDRYSEVPIQNDRYFLGAMFRRNNNTDQELTLIQKCLPCPIFNVFFQNHKVATTKEGTCGPLLIEFNQKMCKDSSFLLYHKIWCYLIEEYSNSKSNEGYLLLRNGQLAADFMRR